MRYAEYRPSPSLAGLVERFWMLDGTASGTPDPILPDGRVEIVFHYGGTFWRHDAETSAAGEPGPTAPGSANGSAASESAIHGSALSGSVASASATRAARQRQPDAMVVGQMLAPVILAPEGRVGVAAVRLRPAAARRLFGFSPGEIVGQFVDLTLLFPSAARVRERLADAPDDGGRIAILEGWLARHVRGDGDDRVEAAVREIAARDGRAAIDTLAARTGLHVRQLERYFLRDVGLTPKTFARISRLQAALRRIREGMPLSDVAVACGFYDQAHMTRDFRQLAAMSPGAWQAHAGDLAPLFVAGER